MEETSFLVEKERGQNKQRKPREKSAIGVCMREREREASMCG